MQTHELELHTNLVQTALDSTAYVLYANSSAEEIEQVTVEGLKVTEGRATVSSNLVYSYDIANTKVKTTNVAIETDEEESGSVIVIKLPEDKKASFATFSDIVINSEKKLVSGDPLKYIAAFKQLGVYSQGDSLARKAEVEAIPLANRATLSITPQDFNMFLQTNTGLDTVIADLSGKARSFLKVDFEQVSAQIKASSSTFGVNPEVLKEVVISTVVAISVARIRNLSLNILRAQGYQILNKKNEIISQIFNAENLGLKLKDLKTKVEDPDFDLGVEWLNTYVKENIIQLAQQIEG